MLSKPLHITAKAKPSLSDMATQTIRDALLLILWTGMRRGECVNLMWDDVQGNVLHVRGTKTESSNRTVPLSSDAKALLDRRKFTANCEWIFPTRSKRPLTATNLLRWMTSHTSHTVHDLRHTYCTRRAGGGINPKRCCKPLPDMPEWKHYLIYILPCYRCLTERMLLQKCLPVANRLQMQNNRLNNLIFLKYKKADNTTLPAFRMVGVTRIERATSCTPSMINVNLQIFYRKLHCITGIIGHANS